jgi:hypothetical protein
MAKRMMVAMFVMAIVAAASVAMAAPTAEYVGTFKAASGWYRSGITLVPETTNDTRGTVLDDLNAATLLTWAYGNSGDDNLREWYIPTDASLAVVAGDAPPAAVQVATADGGTYVQDGNALGANWPSAITLMGNNTVYGMYGNQAAPGFGGEIPLGTVGVASASIDHQYPPLPSVVGHTTSHWVERGGLAAVAGTTDTLVSVAYRSGGTAIVVGTHVKGAPDTTGFVWTTTPEFYFHTSTTNHRRWAIEYVVFGGSEYYVMYDGTVGHAGDAELLFFDASVFKDTGGGAVDADLTGPTFTIDLNTVMADGWGWNAATTAVMDMTYDAATGRLYLIEDHPNGTRVPGRDAPIHVLQLAVPPTPPVAEPAGLGLLGLALLGLKKRRS